MHDPTADRLAAREQAEAGLGFLLYCLKRSGYRPEPADAARLERLLDRGHRGRALNFAAGCAEGTARINDEMAEEARRALGSELADLKAAATDLARVPRGARNADWRTAARRVAAAHTRLKQMPEEFEAKARRERGHAVDLRRSRASVSRPTVRSTFVRRTPQARPAARRPARRSTSGSARGSPPDGDEGDGPEPGDDAGHELGHRRWRRFVGLPEHRQARAWQRLGLRVAHRRERLRRG